MTADSVFRLARTIATSFDEETTSVAAKREWLADLAGRHDLDLEDTATLFAIAAGEGVTP